MTKDSKLYARAPITEAVIELTFKSPLSQKDLDKVCKKFKTSYPNIESVNQYAIEVNVQHIESGSAKANFRNQSNGFKRSSNDMAEILILWPSSFAVSQLAPYKDWGTFYKRFIRDFKIWKSVVGPKEIARIGVRYINRVDIPVSGSIVDHEDYIQIYPKLPDSLSPMSAFGIQAQVPMPLIGGNLRINSAAVPSPLLNHASFIIDLDFFKDSDLPQSDKSLQALLNTVRDEKNKVFESLITDKARKLFNENN